MRVLLVEDSMRLRKTIGQALRNSQYAVDSTADGEEGLWFAQNNEYDAMILDIMLPGLDGISVLRSLREAGNETHVLLLTAKDAIADRVSGLQAGADDYLVKPFALEELIARVDVLCRRQYASKSNTIQIDDLELHLDRKTVERDGKAIPLTAREYRVLEYLVSRRGQVVSREEIEAHVYDDMAELMSNVVESTICTVRKKIGYQDAKPLIHTRRGMGYIVDAASA